ncbi:GntR family transcriptional regulator [Gryllotalpicola protaetiae]|uniref:GntR family transcriptional regulator n=1 Tax=Gryllotalpicola protaetiae TaxID=2419771 RepID=A0A387BIQ2_9MICO|nr:GntR family transcriptional regulator [Gryllotalpicola protaetiae]AYG03693.1 GntR family transcriptional regulator [Gryllotalpicola protaetiae]
MELRIDAANPAPASEQVRIQLLNAVREGSLPPGVKLPTVRQLADQLGIAVNTVARAYRLLEEDGIVETFGRRGSFIANQGDAVQQQLQAAATQFARKAASLGASVREAEQAVIAAIKAELR